MINSANIYLPTNETEKRFIKSIWLLQEFNTMPRTETILPKGTVEIIFNFSDDVVYCNSNLDIKKALPRCFVNGVNFKPFNLIKNRQQVFLGVQLNALGLKILFDVPVSDFNNTVVEGYQVCESLNTLSNQLFQKKTFKNQVEIIMKWIYKKVSHFHYNKAINQVHNLFYSHKLDEKSVKELSNEVNLSERQIRRLSSEWLGMNTETFLRYHRYLTSLHLLHNTNLSLSQIGLEAGYYDQSHFIREFKSFTDIAPKKYQKSKTTLPGHIIG